MKMAIFGSAAFLAASCAFANYVSAQNDASRLSVSDKYTISATAGTVNLITGEVKIARGDGTNLNLMKGDTLSAGERVETSNGARAEILLNPGSYIRLGGNSSFEFVSTDLDMLEVRMHSGSGVFEVFTTRDFSVGVNAGNSQFKIVETGVYRLDVVNEMSAQLSVWDGRAEAGLSGNYKAKDGRRIVFADGSYSIVKFDRGEKDELEAWSAGRGKLLAKTVASLQRDRMRDSLVSGFSGGRWNLYNTFGLWVYDPFFGGYCFLPYGSDWRSPYGVWFRRSIWHFGLPSWIYRQPPPPTYAGRNTTVTSTGTTTNAKPNRTVRRDQPNVWVKEPTRVITADPIRREPRSDSVRPISSPSVTTKRRDNH